MVFELLGPNLEDLFRYCGKRFSIKTTAMLMHQLLCRLESLHQIGLHHRDVKPENFMLGTGRQGNVVYATDMGLAVYQLPSEALATLPQSSKPTQLSLVGTCRYASINGHLDVRKYHGHRILHHQLI
jgi:serine/threonine protein kinase